MTKRSEQGCRAQILNYTSYSTTCLRDLSKPPSFPTLPNHEAETQRRPPLGRPPPGHLGDRLPHRAATLLPQRCGEEPPKHQAPFPMPSYPHLAPRPQAEAARPPYTSPTRRAAVPLHLLRGHGADRAGSLSSARCSPRASRRSPEGCRRGPGGPPTLPSLLRAGEAVREGGGTASSAGASPHDGAIM